MNKIDEHERIMVELAFNSIIKTELMDYFVMYQPSPSTGYMFDRDEVMEKITDQIAKDYDGHSGCSMAFTLRFVKEAIEKVDVIDEKVIYSSRLTDEQIKNMISDAEKEIEDE